MQDTARAKGVQLPVFEARSENEIGTAFASLVRLHAGALVVAGDAFFTQHGQLAGAKPADLPVQQACTYELVVNLKTAQALGLTIPPSILARADEVIE